MTQARSTVHDDAPEMIAEHPDPRQRRPEAPSPREIHRACAVIRETWPPERVEDVAPKQHGNDGRAPGIRVGRLGNARAVRMIGV